MPLTPPPLSEADYDAIEAAVLETMRGRWFLAEYARRNRQADTTMLLAALDRIEAALGGERSVQPVDRIRFDLVEMAKAIARTKAEIAAIKPDADHHGKFGEATEELDSIVQATETATSDILAAAEQIQEIAWTLREQGLEAEACDLLDGKATDVYTACSFQDLTGQRTRKVIQVLHYLEGRINAMIRIWGLDGAMAAEAAETERARSGEVGLLAGPAKPGHGLDQADIDVVMGPAEPAALPNKAPPQPTPAPAPATDDHPDRAFAPPVQAAPATQPAPMTSPLPPAGGTPSPAPAPATDDHPGRAFTPPVRAAPATQPAPMTPPLPRAGGTPPPAPSEARTPAASAVPRSDPLTAVTALSYEEKIALFT
jgi:chemotaxis regulatin CheY-phosphate phosphatase CheZ